MDILKLHEYTEYEDQCATILNDEWKRSKAARLHSLGKSCEQFPINLIMVKRDGEKTMVVGHSRLGVVIGRDNSCLIESVVIKKDLRGKGLGRLLMEKSEAFARSRGFETMYLSTHDKQHFYKHVGYEFCRPVLSFGANILPEHLVKKLIGLEEKNAEVSENCKKQSMTESNNFLTSDSLPLSSPPPPPPLPPPLPATDHNLDNQTGPKNHTITRWDPSEISWMKKQLT